MNWFDDLTRLKLADSPDFPAFGIVLFTEAHPAVVKVLRDEDYWRGLNEVSGPHLTVLANRPPREALYLPPSQMVAVEGSFKELIDALALPPVDKWPILVLLVRADLRDVWRFVAPVESRDADSVYASLAAPLKAASDALEQVAPEHAPSPEGVASALWLAMRDYADRTRLRSAVGWFLQLANVTAAFK